MTNPPDNNNAGVSLQVRGIRKSFGNQEVLKGVDLDVKPGEIFVIMGPSGSGKSVLLKHLIGLESPDAGEILINGESIETEGIAAKYRMALVFQSGALLNSLTVGENVGLYLAEHRLKSTEEIEKIVAEKLETVGLKDAVDKMPGELSGGMKKRAAIARALVNQPKIIFADEPTGNLDSHTGEAILELFRKLSTEGRTIALVTHDPEIAAVTPRRIEIRDGKIADQVDAVLAGQAKR